MKFTHRAMGLAAAASFGFFFMATGETPAQQQITPPQGYVSFQRVFAGPPPLFWNGTQRGHYAFDYEFELRNTSGELAGTFWANNISFHDSASALPANHVGGSQGGYLGVQVKSESESIAIFSIWWALDARPGPGGHCVDEIEAWYTDDRPWEPRIHSMGETDPSRPVAGGPFRSCRLPISLEPNERYRLRLSEIADARQPDAPEWWGAWLVKVSTGEESLIGQLLVPGSWGWLQSGAGGFIEHFGPMPAGCDSIPASSSTFFAALADNSLRSSLSASLYGNCEEPLRPRTRIACTAERCDIELLE